MPKRKKFPRLPNAYGSIRYLGKNRKNCYAVHPPCTGDQRDENGTYIRPKALCYVDDWYVGFAVLNAYHAGTYEPGDELLFKSYKDASSADLDEFCKRLLADHAADRHVEMVKKEAEPTFAQVYEKFYDWKYGEKAVKKLSTDTARGTKSAYGYCRQIHDKVFRDLRLEDLQKCLDDCDKGKGTIGNIMSLFHQMYKYAIPRELCDKNYSEFLTMPDAKESEHGVPFSDEDLAVLWADYAKSKNPVVEMLLVMCYSGFRITAYKSIEVNLESWYFRGGVKTSAGKDRIVPIHTSIRPLVTARMGRDGAMLNISTSEFRKRMHEALSALGIEQHTPHDCRHTFSRLCEKYKVNEADRKRMMGHSFGSDITNAVYGHRTVEELREEIEKIKTPDL